MTQKHCLKCGELLVDGKDFCGGCGARIESDESGNAGNELSSTLTSSEATKTPTAPTRVDDGKRSTQVRKLSPALMAGIAVGVLAVIAVVAVLAFGGFGSGDDTSAVEDRIQSMWREEYGSEVGELDRLADEDEFDEHISSLTGLLQQSFVTSRFGNALPVEGWYFFWPVDESVFDENEPDQVGFLVAVQLEGDDSPVTLRDALIEYYGD